MRKKRRRVNKFKVFRFILVIVLIVGICFGVRELLNKEESINYDSYTKNDIKVEEESNDKIDKVSMIMVGDNLIHDSIYEEASVNGDYDFRPMLELIKPIVSEYDIAYYNQETILGGSEIGVSSYPSFNSPYEVGNAMIDAGFNLVSLATNHTLDRGEKAVINSRNYWDSKTDVLAVGSYDSLEDRNSIDVREINNISYTMLNYTYGTNGIKVPSGKEYLVNVWPVSGSNPDNDSKYQEYKNIVREDIERVRDKVDVLIVAMHWGVEYEYEANSYQIDMAEYLASLDVDIIIGTHPHVIQPIDYIDDTLVIYSLGNFMSAHEVINIGNRVGLMTMLDMVKDKDGKITIENVSNELTYTYYTSDYKDIKVIPFSKMNSSYLENYQDVYNKFRDIVISMNDSIEVVPLS